MLTTALISVYTLHQDWMLASLIPSVLNVGLPLPLAFLLAAPGVIDAIDRRLPHYLVWADITPFTADNASSEASKPTKRLPRWKQAAFILMNAGGAALCAVAAADRLCREPTMSGGSLSDSWRWFSAAEAAILTLIWVRKHSNFPRVAQCAQSTECLFLLPCRHFWRRMGRYDRRRRQSILLWQSTSFSFSRRSFRRRWPTSGRNP